VEVRATLADQDLAGVDGLATEALDARYCELESRPLRVEDAPFCVPCQCLPLVLGLVRFGDDRWTEAQASIAVTLIWVEC